MQYNIQVKLYIFIDNIYFEEEKYHNKLKTWMKQTNKQIAKKNNYTHIAETLA